ncbi:hypothetical protein [Lactococcus allomyrinae]|uniref:Uncharacterized protein n=1 Tax=Lactococcus allomyrinae TaxID=2419773 RepID=A0A387BCR3_9LACT|nr:hypothetical protein [Lactococcus allomyrinae]AYF99801.1 hypothetical protein D7I46_01100 [Lactococcus allomyrinae]
MNKSELGNLLIEVISPAVSTQIYITTFDNDTCLHTWKEVKWKGDSSQEWNEFLEVEVTLNEIYEKFRNTERSQTIVVVVVDGGLSGKIYREDNGFWMQYAETHGYA